MGMFNQPTKIASFLLIGAGVALLGLSLYSDGKINVALPLVFLMLGGACFILVFALGDKWSWAPIFYIPGSLMLSFGVVFLLNVLTGDWSSWAYAWLLLISGTGMGVVLAYRRQAWPPVVNLAAWATALGGVALFALFGAIAQGKLIQIMAPILLILGGLALRFLHPEQVLPESILQRLRFAPAERSEAPLPSDGPFRLVEPLSGREIEVLRLVDQGLTNQEIAAQLSIAPSTVKTHINNLYGKLGVETRTQALHRARELGLLAPDSGNGMHRMG